MISDEYRTIKTDGEGYYTEKRSKFLAFAHHVETVDEIKNLLAAYRKKYYDARHVCYAYMLGAERTEFRANDDGEPSSTAGKPILGQINSNELTDILIDFSGVLTAVLLANILATAISTKKPQGRRMPAQRDEPSASPQRTFQKKERL